VAEIVAVLGASHSPFLYMPPDQWEIVSNRRRSEGRIAAKVPVDGLEVNRAKAQRCESALATLRGVLSDARPDALLIFGDDQGEVFGFEDLPTFALFLGREFAGYKTIGRERVWERGSESGLKPRTAEHWTVLHSLPHVMRHLLVGLLDRGFDPSFLLKIDDRPRGMSHAFMRPSYHLWPDYELPVLPVFINCYYGPQPSGRRCLELGRAVREALEDIPAPYRIAVLGTGGLWHTPEAPDAYINEDFDGAILGFLENGDPEGLAAYYDGQGAALASSDEEEALRLSNGTGVVRGLGSGIGEVRNWIAAAGVAGNRRGVIVDYVPVYASPCGMGFAYWPVR
jgi:hypothetical protein